MWVKAPGTEGNELLMRFEIFSEPGGLAGGKYVSKTNLARIALFD